MLGTQPKAKGVKVDRTLGTRGNSLAKSGRPKAGETSVRSEVSEASEGPNASSLWWRTPMVSLCLIQILYLITDWLFKNVFLPATAVGQKRSREMNRFFSVRQDGVLWRRNVYSEGILLKAKIYIVLVQNLRNNKRERSGHLCLGKMFSPTGPNWVWKTSDFSTLWQPGTIHVLKVLETR